MSNLPEWKPGPYERGAIVQHEGRIFHRTSARGWQETWVLDPWEFVSNDGLWEPALLDVVHIEAMQLARRWIEAAIRTGLARTAGPEDVRRELAKNKVLVALRTALAKFEGEPADANAEEAPAPTEGVGIPPRGVKQRPHRGFRTAEQVLQTRLLAANAIAEGREQQARATRAEVDRLRTANAGLVAACQKVERELGPWLEAAPGHWHGSDFEGVLADARAALAVAAALSPEQKASDGSSNSD